MICFNGCATSPPPACFTNSAGDRKLPWQTHTILTSSPFRYLYKNPSIFFPFGPSPLVVTQGMLNIAFLTTSLQSFPELPELFTAGSRTVAGLCSSPREWRLEGMVAGLCLGSREWRLEGMVAGLCSGSREWRLEGMAGGLGSSSREWRLEGIVAGLGSSSREWTLEGLRASTFLPHTDTIETYLKRKREKVRHVVIMKALYKLQKIHCLEKLRSPVRKAMHSHYSKLEPNHSHLSSHFLQNEDLLCLVSPSQPSRFSSSPSASSSPRGASASAPPSSSAGNEHVLLSGGAYGENARAPVPSPFNAKLDIEEQRFSFWALFGSTPNFPFSESPRLSSISPSSPPATAPPPFLSFVCILRSKFAGKLPPGTHKFNGSLANEKHPIPRSSSASAID
nr:predicted protein [Ipomoea batatas]